MDDSRVRKASDLLGALLSPKVAEKAELWSRFFSFWSRAAGENLAAHSRPVDVRNGIVFVEADHPGWIQLLQIDQGRILEMIRHSFPALGISGIAFRMAKDGSVPGTTRLGTEHGNQTGAELAETGTELAAESDAKSDDESQGDKPQGDRARAVPMPTVAQTLQGVADDSFRGILSSLAGTLESENRDKARLKAAGRGPKTR